ncbi:MAG: hypothetical protein E6I52_05655 [Chloroflexi bacterium]|nr:MAG: hypothetical protein E6I52_05655 [Chloroflexota bacterium]
MARPAPPDDGSPVRLVATMVGIVGILLLGSLTWTAVGAFFSALGEAASTLTPRPTPTRFPTAVAALGDVVVATPTQRTAPTGTPTLVVIATSTPLPTALPATAEADGRAPWILLPRPAPGSRVPPGAVTVEARGRGAAPITALRLDLDEHQRHRRPTLRPRHGRR